MRVSFEKSGRKDRDAKRNDRRTSKVEIETEENSPRYK